MRILIIDQCSGTKSFQESLPVVNQDGTRNADAEEILESLDIDGIQANDLYAGKQQKRITEAVHTLRRKNHEVERYFISAGFGLVSDGQRLPPYEATFNSMSKAEIADRKREFQITERLTEIIDTGNFDVVFLALGSMYYEAIDLDSLLSSVPANTAVVLFNQESLEEDRRVVSVPARTEQGAEFGSSVIGLKGTYLMNFAAAVEDSQNSITPKEAAKYCLTDPSSGSQSGIDNYLE